MLSVMGAKADVIPSSYYSEPAAGDFYLYNVTQQRFLTGTPSMSAEPAALTLAVVDGSLYSIKSGNYLKMGHYNSQFLWNNSWADDEYFKWTFTPTSDKKYHLSIHVSSNKDDHSYTFVANTDYYLNTVNSVTTTAGEANEWALITAANYETYRIENAAAVNKSIIVAAKGDATSLVKDKNLDDEETGWTGGQYVNCNTWRGGNRDYENESSADAVFTQTLNNMPAGTYKVVGAVRGAVGTTATAILGNGSTSASGTTINNGEFDTSRQQINTNGVQMPYSSLGGFQSGNALGWQWATATYTLPSDGDLVISFAMSGTGFRGLDDVRLYYMSDGTKTYAVEYSDGINNDDHVVTCDLQTDNPNKIFRASSNIYTASGAITNNLRINSNGWINKLVLYDGYELSIPSGSRSVNSTLYRNIAAGTFATVCCPFEITGGADGTFYQPASLTDGTLNFETVTTKNGGKAYLYKASSAVTALTHAGDHWLAENITANGTDVNMVGTYTNIKTITYDDYVLNGTNLYKVNSAVSLKPFRAYFTVAGGRAVKANVIGLNFDGETTGIQEIGQLENLQFDNWYDLSGRRVAQPRSGLYIVNGKKVVIK